MSDGLDDGLGPLVNIRAIDPVAIPGLNDGDQVAQCREVLDSLGQPDVSVIG